MLTVTVTVSWSPSAPIVASVIVSSNGMSPAAGSLNTPTFLMVTGRASVPLAVNVLEIV